MRLRSVLVACSVLLGAGALVAQSPGRRIRLRRLAGGWTDSSEPDVRRQERRVGHDRRGPARQPGGDQDRNVRSKTGTLKLAGDARHPTDGTPVHFVIDGKLAGDALSVNADFGTDKATKTLTKAAAQPAAGDGTAVALRQSFSEVSGWVTRAADLVPPDKYLSAGADRAHVRRADRSRRGRTELPLRAGGRAKGGVVESDRERPHGQGDGRAEAQTVDRCVQRGMRWRRPGERARHQHRPYEPALREHHHVYAHARIGAAIELARNSQADRFLRCQRATGRKGGERESPFSLAPVSSWRRVSPGISAPGAAVARM